LRDDRLWLDRRDWGGIEPGRARRRGIGCGLRCGATRRLGYDAGLLIVEVILSASTAGGVGWNQRLRKR
jgi:hypothetical protein